MSLQVNNARPNRNISVQVNMFLIVNLNFGYPVSVWDERGKAIRECEELNAEGEYIYEVRAVPLNQKGGAVQ